MYKLYDYVFFFFIYAFLGWCAEVCFAALKSGKFVNRGFLNGPVCPIYGFGVVIVVALLTPVKENFLLLFVCSVFLTSALEWLTGFVLEKVFHQKWWDYSDVPFNLNGYICPIFSLVWGFACLIIMDMIQPPIASLVRHIPHLPGLIILCVLGIILCVDVVATVTSMIGLNKRLRQIEELAAKIHAASDELGENLADATLSITEKGADLKEDLAERKADLAELKAAQKADLADLKAAQKATLAARRTAREAALKRREAALAELKAANEELLSTYGFGQRHLLNAFPDVTSTRHYAALEQVKTRAREKRLSRRGEHTDKKDS